MIPLGEKSIEERLKELEEYCYENINLFDGALELGVIINGNLSENTKGVRTKNYQSVIPNTQYSISNDLNYTHFIYEYDENFTYIKQIYDQPNPAVFKTSDKTKYIKFRTATANNENDLNVKFKMTIKK